MLFEIWAVVEKLFLLLTHYSITRPLYFDMWEWLLRPHPPVKLSRVGIEAQYNIFKRNMPKKFFYPSLVL